MTDIALTVRRRIAASPQRLFEAWTTPAALPDAVLDAIVRAALAKDPTHRTMSADALGQRLRALRGG